MMATVPHVTSGLGLRKFQAGGFLLTRVYNKYNYHPASNSNSGQNIYFLCIYVFIYSCTYWKLTVFSPYNIGKSEEKL